MNLRDVLGQPQAVAALVRALESDKLSHAYLFHGEDGVGKRTTGQALAAHILCEQGTACGQCRACRLLAGGNHPDFQLWSGSGSIKIDEVRQLKSEMSRAADGPRVWLMVDVDRMTIPAANSFLKALEEPTPNTFFVLTTNYLHRLLPTVISRCQLVGFHKLTEAQIVQGLREVENEAGHGEKAELIARLSRGSLGRAVALSDAAFLERRQATLKTLIRIPDASYAEVMGFSLKWDESRDAVISDLELMVQWFRDLLCVQYGKHVRLYNPDYSKELQRLQPRFPKPVIHEILDLLNEMIPTLKGNARPRFVLGYILLLIKKGALI